jgi:hypothetical protein
MKALLKLAVGKIFGGLGWLLQSIIEHWKIWVIVGAVAYVFLLNFRVRNLDSENKILSDTVFRQDSTLVAMRSKYMVDSVNLGLRELSMQNTVNQLRDKNKELERDVINKEQLIKDLADGVKCKNIFGRIVNCK